MKSFSIATCIFFALIKISMAAPPGSLSVEIDADKLRYRVQFRIDGSDTAYDSFDLIAPDDGLAPRGARVHVKDGLARPIAGVDTERGYSSAELYSGSPDFKYSYKKAPSTDTIYTEWFEIGDLVRGLEQCSKTPSENWAQLQISFSIGTRGKENDQIEGRSVWFALSPADRRKLAAVRR